MKQFSIIFLFALLALTLAETIEKCEIGLLDCVQNSAKVLPLDPDNCKCRLGASSRIIGGKIAERNQIPWMVSLATPGPLNIGPDNHFCGGTIINHNYVLTAAYCVADKKPDKVKVRVGIQRLNDTDIKKKTYNVANILEKDYENSLLPNDIALLKLAKPIKFMAGIVEPACLNFKQMNYSNELMAAGWGGYQLIYERKKRHPRVTYGPMSLDLKLAYFNETNASDIALKCDSKYLICIDTENGDSVCFGDSGSPLHYDHNGKTAVEGIAAAPYSTKETRDEYVFCTGKSGATRLSYYRRWIREVIGDNYCHV